MQDYDIDDFFDGAGAEVVETEHLNQLGALLATRKDLLDLKEKLDGEMKRVNEQLLDIETRQIPDLMDNAGVAEFTTKDGLKIGVKPFVSAIPANFKEDAYKWFDDNGLDSIIKRTVSLKFDKKQADQAKLAIERLEDMGFQPDEKLDIAYQTFQATVKELHEKGIMPPLHEWGVYFGRRATVKKK